MPMMPMEPAKARRQEAHGSLSLRRAPCLRAFCGRPRPFGGAVADDLPVQQADDAGGVLVCQLRIVGHHDHQPVPGHLPQDLHDLDAGLTVQGAGGFVRQEHLRIVNQGPGDRHALHLAAAELVGFLFHLVREADLLQGFRRPAPAFLPADAGQGQRQLHVGQHRLVRDQVIALEHKAHGVVPVGVPFPFRELLRGLPPDDQVPGGIPVQAADDVQQRGLAAAGGPQDRGELAPAEGQVDPPERRHGHAAGNIILCDAFSPVRVHIIP